MTQSTIESFDEQITEYEQFEKQAIPDDRVIVLSDGKSIPIISSFLLDLDTLKQRSKKILLLSNEEYIHKIMETTKSRFWRWSQTGFPEFDMQNEKKKIC